MSKHSTGPWKWEEGQPKIFTTWNGKDYVVASVEESRLGWHEDRNCESRERGANAKLIAAAPDLMQALKSIIAIGEHRPQNIAEAQTQRYSQWAVDIARAAINIAEGRS